jgi:hypothetical protein
MTSTNPPGGSSKTAYTPLVASPVARVSWDLPNDLEKAVLLHEDDFLVFGRAAKCHIQLGRLPYDDCVPTIWGKISWGRRVRVENLAERAAQWSFTLRPTFEPDSPRHESPCDVAPGMECSLACQQFEIRAQAPSGLRIEYVIRVNSFQPRRIVVIGGETPSVIEVALSETERAVANALVAPLDDGQPGPATYAECAALTHFSRDGVRDALERIDSKFARAGLYPHGMTGRTPERVSRVLIKHRQLLR